MTASPGMWHGGMLRAAPALLAASLITLPLSGCDSRKSDIRHAYAAAFPDGHEVCFGARFINALPAMQGTIYYPGDGITSPLRHLFVFYVAPASAPVAVSIYTTAPQDPRFSYTLQNPSLISPGDGGLLGNLMAPVFASRVFDNPLPPPDVDYAIPLVAPYTISLVAGECYTETLSQIMNVTQVQGFDGSTLVKADVLLQPNAPDWMKTPEFRAAANSAYGQTPSLNSPRQTTLVFKQDGDKLRYLEEEQEVEP